MGKTWLMSPSAAPSYYVSFAFVPAVESELKLAQKFVASFFRSKNAVGRDEKGPRRRMDSCFSLYIYIYIHICMICATVNIMHGRAIFRLDIGLYITTVHYGPYDERLYVRSLSFEITRKTDRSSYALPRGSRYPIIKDLGPQKP